ncbi:hypothetical protein RYX36_026333 [Vicia faba]
MGENPGSGSQYVAVGESASPKATNHMRKVSVLPLVFLIFYEVSGGPFGVEDTVKAAGPLLALLGFLVFPFIWSVPEALITAEMGTMFPENSGYVVWVSTALGPFWGFQQGWMKWLSGVIDNALLTPRIYQPYLYSLKQCRTDWTRALVILIMTSYLPEEMRKPSTFKWMLQNPEFRQRLEEMLNNMGGGTEWDSRMMDTLKNFDLNSPAVKQQFDQIGLSPEEVISKIMANPDFAMAFQNPRVQAAIMDCSQNPMSIAKYQNDKEVMDVFYKISELFPGVSGPP